MALAAVAGGVSGLRLRSEPPRRGPSSGSPAARPRIEKLKVRERGADLPCDLALDQVDQPANRLDPDPRLLEVLLVGLGDAPDGQVHDRSSALDEEVLDADVAKLLLDLCAELLFGRLLRGVCLPSLEPIQRRSARARRCAASPRRSRDRCRRSQRRHASASIERLRPVSLGQRRSRPSSPAAAGALHSARRSTTLLVATSPPPPRQSIISPSRPHLIARQRFSSISRPASGSGSAPSS